MSNSTLSNKKPSPSSESPVSSPMRDEWNKVYDPCVNDRIRWKEHEGWVYWKCDDYITIEIGVKEKTCNLTDHLHKKDHILLVCYKQFWNEIEYLRSRKSIYDR